MLYEYHGKLVQNVSEWHILDSLDLVCIQKEV